MSFEVTPFAAISAAAGWISSLVATYAWTRRRLVPGAHALFWLMLAVAEWSFGAAVELTVRGVPAKLAWSKLEYLGTLGAPVLLLVFALEFGRREAWLARRRIAPLFAFPALTWMLALTNELHGLVWSGTRASDAGANLLVYERGPWFWIGVVGYSYLCLAAGTALLARDALRLPGALRRQAATLLVAAAIPWLANASYVFGFFPIVGLDPTPLSVAAMGAVCAVAIFRYGLLDVRPAAREAVVERMPDGVIVFDESEEVVEINPAARALFGAVAPRPGQRLEEAFAAWPTFVAAARAGEGARLELVVAHERGGRALEADLAALGEAAGHRAGRVLVLHDVTDRQRVEGELRVANRRLAEQLAAIEGLEATLREQAMRDSLTGVYNRRYLDETLAREFARSERGREALSVLLLDLDHFKALNDRHGHAAGDEVLRELGLLLRAKTRKADIACRYGGEEFLVVLPQTGASGASLHGEELREAFAGAAFRGAAAGVSCTLSVGVATFPVHAATLEGLLASADLALYAAKAGGRNRVVVAR